MATIDDIRFDDAGLVPAVLIDCDTREVLMVAWMNAESLRMTCESGLATFWSRSRQELWTKGLTSGNLMHVQSITADCDCDTLLVEVRPDGPACHKGTVSCFTNPFVMAGAADDMRACIENLPRPFDLHMHTTFSDGDATPEQMAGQACALGLSAVGITDHSHTDFDAGYCMAAGEYEAYQADVRRVAEQFADRITVFCGIEQDIFSEPAEAGFDYIIGSVHYVEVPLACAEAAGAHITPDGAHAYVSVDETEELFVKAAEACFGGDYLAFAEAYFQTVAEVIERTGADIVGHLDLFAKFNEGGRYFDETDPRYMAAWQKACDALLATDALFEVNHGAVVNGRRIQPYPTATIQSYLRERGARFVVTSDAHSTSALAAMWG